MINLVTITTWQKLILIVKYVTIRYYIVIVCVLIVANEMNVNVLYLMQPLEDKKILKITLIFVL